MNTRLVHDGLQFTERENQRVFLFVDRVDAHLEEANGHQGEHRQRRKFFHFVVRPQNQRSRSMRCTSL